MHRYNPRPWQMYLQQCVYRACLQFLLFGLSGMSDTFRAERVQG